MIWPGLWLVGVGTGLAGNSGLLTVTFIKMRLLVGKVKDGWGPVTEVRVSDVFHQKASRIK